MTRYYAIDIGTNSCRLLIADLELARLQAVFRALNSTRLGQGLYTSQELSAAAMERTVACLRDFRRWAEFYGAYQGRVIATSAVREARNGADFIDLCRSAAGAGAEVISGEEEAALSYAGASQGLPLATPPLLVDLGGGSAEFICPPQNLLSSLPLGAVRASEQNLERAAIAAVLHPLRPHRETLRGHPLVFVGGTATTLAAIQLELKEYRSELVHGHTMSRAALQALYQRLNALSLPQRRLLPGLQPERADIIVHGALIVLTIMEELDRDHCTMSECDLLEGAILSRAGNSAPARPPAGEN